MVVFSPSWYTSTSSRSELPAKIDPAVISGISIVTLILTLLFSVIPALMAARTEPARALSHE